METTQKVTQVSLGGEKVQNVGWEVGEKVSLRISSEAVPRD